MSVLQNKYVWVGNKRLAHHLSSRVPEEIPNTGYKGKILLSFEELGQGMRMLVPPSFQ